MDRCVSDTDLEVGWKSKDTQSGRGDWLARGMRMGEHVNQE